MAPNLDRDLLESCCVGTLGGPVRGVLIAGLHPGEGGTDAVGPALAGAGPDLAGLVILQEAWQPPISQTLASLRLVRAAAGERLPLILLLAGRPLPGRVVTPPGAMDLEIWKSFASRLEDPLVQLVPLEAS
jgi:hypothetical protein